MSDTLYSSLLQQFMQDKTANPLGLKSVQQIALAPGASNVVNTSGTTTTGTGTTGVQSSAQNLQSYMSMGSQGFGTLMQVKGQVTQSKIAANQTTTQQQQWAAQQQQQASQLSAAAKAQQQQLSTNLTAADNKQESAWQKYQDAKAYDNQTINNLSNQKSSAQAQLDAANAEVQRLSPQVKSDLAIINDPDQIPSSDAYKQALADYNRNQAYLTQQSQIASQKQIEISGYDQQINKAQADTNSAYSNYSDAYNDYSSAYDAANPENSNMPSNGGQGNSTAPSQNLGSGMPNYQQASYTPISNQDFNAILASKGLTVSETDSGLKVFAPDGTSEDYSILKNQFEQNFVPNTPTSSGAPNIAPSNSGGGSGGGSIGSTTSAAAAASVPKHLGDVEGFSGVGTEIGSGLGLFSSVQSGSVMGAIASAGGLVAGMEMINGAVMASMVPGIDGFVAGSFGSILSGIPILGHMFMWMALNPLLTAAIIAAIIVVIALLTRKPDAEEQSLIKGAQQLSVWDSSVKPLILSAAAATALFAMGNGIDQPMSSLATPGISVPTSDLSAALKGGISAADGSAYVGNGNLPYNTPLIIKGGAAGGGDSVIFLGDGGVQNGVQMEKVYHYDTGSNMAVTTPCNDTSKGCTGLYVPIFNADGTLNSEAFNVQSNMLNSASGLSGTSAQTAVHIAAAANKQNTTVTPVP